MAQPVFITEAGNLGTIPEGKFFQVPILAYDPDDPDNPNAVYYVMVAGELPEGIQCTKTGLIEGIPKAIASLQGVPNEVSRDVTSKFVVRAYTEKLVNGVEVVDRLRDRTFLLTVTGQDVPDFITPPGNIGTFYDGDQIELQIEFTDTDPGDVVTVQLASGTLPPGLTVSSTGVISGTIEPLTGPPDTASPGFDNSNFSIYPFDYATRSLSKNYQFMLEITDGKDSNLRTFEIYVYSKDSMTGDTTDFSGDNSFITADIVPARTPVLLTPPGDIGRVRHDNWFAFQFVGEDLDGDAIEYTITTGAGIGFDADGYGFDETGIGFDRGNFDLPPGLTLDSSTGWLYGYIPSQGITEIDYRFAIRVRKKDAPSYVSDFYYFTLTIIGNVESGVTWLTDSDLGTIRNGDISTLVIAAQAASGKQLSYRLRGGDYSFATPGGLGQYNKLPQGLSLLSTGEIAGRVSFNTFALDSGSTTFDANIRTRLIAQETTFDRSFSFTVEAYNEDVTSVLYSVSSIRLLGGGSDYTTATVTIAAPTASSAAIPATAGTVTISGGIISSIGIGNPGAGYTSPPTITITGDGSGASAEAVMVETRRLGAISVFRTFTITLDRSFNEPYVGLYIKCMPPQNDRDSIADLLWNQDLINVDYLYRPNDPYFGRAGSVKYAHAYGLSAATLADYVSALDINHYRKTLVLGEIKTAQALDSSGNVLYEVVYSEIQDDLVNNKGQSVAKSVKLNYPINAGDSTEIDTVYPNSLDNMRDQVIDIVGQVTPGLPLWMTTKQENGQVLGFTRAWVICYTIPGKSKEIAYNITNYFTGSLNSIDFQVDRYELEGQMTRWWTPFNDSTLPGNWVSASSVTLDRNSGDETTLDGGSLRLIHPVDVYGRTDEYDKYLVFPRTNILG